MQATERRDAFIISMYQGLEGANLLQAERQKNSLEAYAHQANIVAVMENKNKYFGLELLPWGYLNPFISFALTPIVPTPDNNWSEEMIKTQKTRLDQIKTNLLKKE